MPPRQKGAASLEKPGAWIDWYDSLLDVALEYDLKDIVDLEANTPVDEILLLKPEKPNPLALFPQLLGALPQETRN